MDSNQINNPPCEGVKKEINETELNKNQTVVSTSGDFKGIIVQGIQDFFNTEFSALFSNVWDVGTNSRKKSKTNPPFKHWADLLLQIYSIFNLIMSNPNLAWEGLAQDYLIQKGLSSVNLHNCSTNVQKLTTFVHYIYEQAIQSQNKGFQQITISPDVKGKYIFSKLIKLGHHLSQLKNQPKYSDVCFWNDFWNTIRTKGKQVTGQTKIYPILGVLDNVLTEECFDQFFGNNQLIEHNFSALVNGYNNKNNKATVAFGLQIWASVESSNGLNPNNQTVSFVTTPGWKTRFPNFFCDPFVLILPSNSNQKSFSEADIEGLMCINQFWLSQSQSQLQAKISQILKKAFEKNITCFGPSRQVLISTPVGDKIIDVLLFGCGGNELYPVVIEIKGLRVCFTHWKDVCQTLDYCEVLDKAIKNARNHSTSNCNNSEFFFQDSSIFDLMGNYDKIHPPLGIMFFYKFPILAGLQQIQDAINTHITPAYSVLVLEYALEENVDSNRKINYPSDFI